MKSLARYVLRRSRRAAAARIHLEMIRPALMGRQRRAARSWSQFGEDEFLVRQLGGSGDDARDAFAQGYYVDIGANHPARLSNTYRLYNLGMRGLCIDPNEMLCGLIARYRPEDDVVACAVGPEDKLARFYELVRHEFSTFSQAEYEMRIAHGHRLRRAAMKPVLRLATILQGYQPSGGRTRFELLSVDTEGWDEQVLRSNDWTRFRPRLIVVESNTDQARAGTQAYLQSVGYELVNTFDINGIFRNVQEAR
jgi:hypothetical protein